VGYASFYHDKFEGRKTSSGEKFKQKKMTCAHRTLPFGTKLRVTNLANNKEVVVTVNDRGPYSKGRIIDLTKAAAKELDFIKNGHAKVEIELLKDVSVVAARDTIETYRIINHSESNLTGFGIQVGNFANKDNMDQLISRMQRELDQPVYVLRKGKGKDQTYHVMAGQFDTRVEAFQYLDKIISSYPGAFIVALGRD
jgi:rare lipoprotein A